MRLQIKRFLEPVKESGSYTIRAVTPKPELKYSPLLLELTKDDDGVAHGLFIPTWNQIEANLNTNLGRLVLAFSDETDKWVGKKVDIKIDDRGRRLV
jgi:hypothetical protein